ncbi:hypothetical protein AM493_11060 [Flavobacterium akiainvivens]|uniref:Peptidase M56 domain-containing protein n=1 Tax=Flavobacterium akiainvivens TaxID=1202724 RepID=A0A0M8M9R2_9FLAO|nr:M56 family metallopeptidase [Flavobacterium akiainvivens]KOS06513.1 hypothetical protein AM493_11060 [Flavobacterium akiainvivens]SFQ11709.1 Signal transducer regulating beta-lactamase production, contains metallopeptidase domain [Flavobacterium akiainvivens]
MTRFLIISTISMAILLAVYYLLLQREKMHRFNRFYLLGAIVFSLAIPFINIGTPPVLQSFALPEITVGVIPKTTETLTTVNRLWIVQIIYGLVAFLFLLRLFIGVRNFYTVARKSKKTGLGNATIVLVDNLSLPYTFARMVFVNKQEYEANRLPEQLLNHELAHSTQHHTFDILFIEMLKSIFWLNPLIYLYKRAIQLNHEFLADEAALSNGAPKAEYLELLLQKATYQNHIALASNLNFGMTKERFIMITKTTNPMKKLLKQLAILPIATALILVSCSDEPSNTQTPEQKKLQEMNDYKEWASKKNSEVNTKLPQYPGGMTAFYKQVIANFDTTKAPAGDKRLRLTVSFIVDTDGTVSDIKALKSPSQQLTDEAIKVIKASGKWIPAQDDNGNAVRASYILPITLETH